MERCQFYFVTRWKIIIPWGIAWGTYHHHPTPPALSPSLDPPHNHPPTPSTPPPHPTIPPPPTPHTHLPSPQHTTTTPNHPTTTYTTHTPTHPQCTTPITHPPQHTTTPNTHPSLTSTSTTAPPTPPPTHFMNPPTTHRVATFRFRLNSLCFPGVHDQFPCVIQYINNKYFYKWPAPPLTAILSSILFNNNITS